MPPKPPHKPPLTHFLCLPLVTSASRVQFLPSLHRFSNDVSAHLSPSTSADSTPAMPEHDGGGVKIPTSATSSETTNPAGSMHAKLGRAIRPLGTLHLTLGVMSLPDQAGVDRAVELLRSIDQREMLRGAAQPHAAHDPLPDASAPMEDPQPLSVDLTSLATMQSPAKTTLLYTRPVDKTNRLYPFCKQLREIFVSSGLITPEDRPLLLHVTVLNTIYAGGRGGKGKGKRWTFDARDLIREYEDVEFAAGVELEKIAICKMGATRVVDEQGQLTEEEEYEVVAERTILGGDG